MDKFNIKKNLIFLMIILISISILSFVFYQIINESSINDFPDKNTNLLCSYKESIDFNDLLTHQNEINEVATRYSCLYKDGINREMYVFSMPVRNEYSKLYSTINTSIEDISDGTYITENIDYDIVYTDKFVNIGNTNNWFKLIVDENTDIKFIDSYNSIYGKRDAISYTFENGLEVCCFPSYSGIVLNCNIKEKVSSISFPVDFENYNINNKNKGYVILSNKNSDVDDIMSENAFIISQPVVSNYNKDVDLKSEIKIKKYGEKKHLTLSFSEEATYPITVSFTINYYCENMFFDCAAYQSEPNKNHIFDSYIIFNAMDSIDQTYNYIKFNLRSFTPKNADYLDKILLNINVVYCTEEFEIEVYSVPYRWCSWELSWNNKPNYGGKIGEFKISKSGWYSIDLTEYAKYVINKDYQGLVDNTIMLKIKDGTTGYAILSSTDNSVCPPYFKVNYIVN